MSIKKSVNLPVVEVETANNPNYVIIWLHGLGADGNDFVPIVDELKPFCNKPIRFIFPHAPERPISINNGYVMRAWYDILYPDISNNHHDQVGICTSQQAINNLIIREMERGMVSKHIVLAGFSQGGAMALHVGLRQNNQLAGIIALSCYLPLAETFRSRASAINVKTPIFMAHGTYDSIIPLSHAIASRDKLLEANYIVNWQEYPMAHSLCQQEVEDIGYWLHQRIDCAT